MPYDNKTGQPTAEFQYLEEKITVQFDTQKVWLNARLASTEDLLDRVTVFRAGMETEALAIIEAELRARGITPEAIQAHARHQESICPRGTDGMTMPCSFCRKPALAEGWGWQRLWNVLPIFPRKFRYCQEHQPDAQAR